MRLAAAILAATLGPFATQARAAAPPRPVVVELFTSQGCSSCPPADAYLSDLARSRPDILALAFHVTYWDSLGWSDPFALRASTERQRAYSGVLGTTVYTPQMVVDGRADVVGSDRADAGAAIARAASDETALVGLSLARDGQGVRIDVPAGHGSGQVWLVGYDDQHRTQVGRGENGGRTLLESNIVRGIVAAGTWSGAPLQIESAAPEGEHLAALLQAADGHFLGVARL